VHEPLPLDATIWPQIKALSELFSCRYPPLRKILPLYIPAPLQQKVLISERLVAWWDPNYAVIWRLQSTLRLEKQFRKESTVFKTLLVG